MSRSVLKQKRLSRNSAVIEDALRQVGSVKKLYYSSHVCTIYRDNASRLEPFSELKANSLVNKYHKKRQAHCTGKLFGDRFTLEKTKSRGVAPFRSWISYKEIKHVYGSHSKPEYFVLCIDSTLSKRRYYEVYKCKSIRDCETFQNRIKQALDDPDKIIRDPDAIRTENVVEDSRVRSVVNFEYQNDGSYPTESVIIPDNRQSSTYEIEFEQPPSPKPVVVQRPVVAARPPSPVMIQRSPSPVVLQKTYPLKQNNYSEVTAVNADPDGTHDTIYITFDSKRLARASNAGPVYMYSMTNNYLPGRSQWGSTEHIDRNRVSSAYNDVGRTNSLPDFYVKPQQEIPVYAQPTYKRSPSPIIEHQKPVRDYVPIEQPNEVILIQRQPQQSAVYNPSPEPAYNNNNNNNNSNNNYYKNDDSEDELSDLTYISFIPNKGAIISDRGPVYMYRKNCRKSNDQGSIYNSKPRVMNGHASDWVYQ